MLGGWPSLARVVAHTSLDVFRAEEMKNTEVRQEWGALTH